MTKLTGNKRAEGPISLEAIVRLLGSIMAFGALVALFVVLWPSTANEGEQEVLAFYDFIEDTNNLDKPIDSTILRLEEDSAVIGFSKSAERFEYVKSSQDDLEDWNPTSTFNKPDNTECKDKACICLCQEGISGSLELSCDSELICRSLDIDIIPRNLIFEGQPASRIERLPYRYWKYGFMLGKDLDPSINGLPEDNANVVDVFVEKRKLGDKEFLGFCSPAMDHRIQSQENLRAEDFPGKCIITEFDEAKNFISNKERFESIFPDKDKPIKDAIKKYESFIENYRSGREAEESLFRLGELYLDLDQKEKAIESFTKLVDMEDTLTSFKDRAEEQLSSLDSGKN